MTLSPSYLAALDLGRRLQGKVHSPHATPIFIADFITTAATSPWVTLLRDWTTRPPPEAPPTFPLACKVAVQIVGLGYRPDLNLWWVMDHWNPNQRDVAQVLLIDLVLWIQPRRGVLTNHQRMLLRQIETFLEILIGPTWRQRRGMIMAKYGGDERTVLRVSAAEANHIAGPVLPAPHEVRP